MKRTLTIAAATLIAACGGGESTKPPVPTSVSVSTSTLAFNSLGATQSVTATVLDENGNAMPGEAITWSSNTSAVELTPSGSTVQVKALSNGFAQVRAASGTLMQNVSVTIAQLPAAITRVSGDGQSAPRGTAIPIAPSVRVTDAGGAPVAGVGVVFTETTGGTVIGANQTTDGDGIATVGVWTLGPNEGTSRLQATVVSANPVPPVNFEATALPGDIPSFATIHAGGWQASLQGTAVPVPPAVILRDANSNPVSGRTVLFEVTGGNGSITQSSVQTNGAGVAQISGWTLGSTAGLNSVKATVQGSAVTNPELTFQATGCTTAPSTGFGINVCFLTPVTDNQRAAFVNAAARWSSIITGDNSNVQATISSPSCGTNPPALDMVIDDLLIFARIENIDGPGSVLGSAGPCYFRSGSPNLPVIGAMRFDSSDLPTLEAAGQFNDVILHEMGHVLGIGIRVSINTTPALWSPLLVNPSTPGTGAGCATGAVSLDTHFTGTAAIAAFDQMMPGYGGAKVPVANVSCSGSINSHWRESVLGAELMTPNLNSNVPNPLSILTVMSLQDIGYQVDPSAADVRTEAGLMAEHGTITGKIYLGNDILVGPIHTIDEKGRVRRVQ